MFQTFGHPVEICCNMMHGVGSNLISCNNFGCCMMLYSFGRVCAKLLHRNSRHRNRLEQTPEHCFTGACAIVRFAISKCHPTYCNRVAKRVQHVVHSNVVICCVEKLRAFDQLLHSNIQQCCTMLRAFGRAFKIDEILDLIILTMLVYRPLMHSK